MRRTDRRPARLVLQQARGIVNEACGGLRPVGNAPGQDLDRLPLAFAGDAIEPADRAAATTNWDRLKARAGRSRGTARLAFDRGSTKKQDQDCAAQRMASSNRALCRLTPRWEPYAPNEILSGSGHSRRGGAEHFQPHGTSIVAATLAYAAPTIEFIISMSTAPIDCPIILQYSPNSSSCNSHVWRPS
jgi:hypothetical protein